MGGINYISESGETTQYLGTGNMRTMYCIMDYSGGL